MQHANDARIDPQPEAQDYFAQTTGVSWSALMEHITDQQPSGIPLRIDPVYRQIQDARRCDDPTLPRGPWEQDLKQSDWAKVSQLCAHAIAEQSKDLQLTAWLLEAQIHQWGLVSIAPVFQLFKALCDTYWDTLYPQIEQGDLEFRTNIISWINEKLVTQLHLIPLTHANNRAYTWADWEQANRNEQILSVHGSQVEDHLEGPTVADFVNAMTSTASEFHQQTHFSLIEGIAALDAFDDVLESLCGDEAPSLNYFRMALQHMAGLVESELSKRGHGVEVALPDHSVEAASNDAFVGRAPTRDMPAQGGSNPAVQTRQDAYQMLAQAADILTRLEPHSPAPYLIRRAIEWGNLNTAQLYHELFVRFGGQLNIFELLGIQENSDGQAAEYDQ